MTMPSIINNTQSKELRTALNKGYSEIYQALEFMKADIGMDVLPSNYANRDFAPVYSKYFKSVKSSSTSGIVSGVNEEGETGPIREFKDYKTYNGSNTVKTAIFDDGQIILADGTLIMIENPSYGGTLYISIDVNGKEKRPNVYGRDLFTFQITDEGKLLPMGADGTDYTDMDRYCSKESNDRINGVACAAKALSDSDFFKK